MSNKNRKAMKNNRKGKGNKKSSMAAKMFLKSAMYVVLIVVVVSVCRWAFEFGEAIFSPDGMAEKGQGKEMVVTIPADSTTQEVASILKEKGLIEDELIFRIQAMIYEAEFYSGTYTLNTEYNAEELIEAMHVEVDD